MSSSLTFRSSGSFTFLRTHFPCVWAPAASSQDQEVHALTLLVLDLPFLTWDADPSLRYPLPECPYLSDLSVVPTRERVPLQGPLDLKGSTKVHEGLPQWSSGCESSCQSGGHGCHPWSRVRSLVQDNSTFLRQIKPLRHSY